MNVVNPAIDAARRLSGIRVLHCLEFSDQACQWCGAARAEITSNDELMTIPEFIESYRFDLDGFGRVFNSRRYVQPPFPREDSPKEPRVQCFRIYGRKRT